MQLTIHDMKTTKTGEVLVIYILADLHLGAEDFDKELYRAVVKEIKANPMARVILPGDITNALRGSSRLRKVMAHADREDELKEVDKNLKAGLDKNIIPLLKPIASKIVAAIDGDHYDFFSKFDKEYAGQTTTQYICDKLNIPYLAEREGGIRFRITYRKRKITFYDVHMRHGLGGGGTTIGGDINKLVKQAFGQVGFHLHVGAHTHKKGIGEWMEEYPSNQFTKVLERKVFAMRCGSFLKNPEYARKAEYKKLSTGWGEVRVCIDYDDNDNLKIGRVAATIV